jgi:serine/threonine protein kinase
VEGLEGKETFPSTFGRYTLVERLATGGMAEVFKAKIVYAHGFEKLLVIKRILPHLAADKSFVAMFIDEAKLTARLIHPKIVQVTDFGDVAGQYFIALEYVDGFDALALMRCSAQRQMRLPIPICIFIALEVLDALDYAHNAKDPEGKDLRIVHRDISPSNVFISLRGDVKLGDFGIAHAQKREAKTQAGTLKGKYGYMSPEQVVGGPIDSRSDIFAVGIVLAEMIMGRRLFTAPNDLDVLLMVRDGRLARLDKYCKDLPAELDTVLRTSLQKKAVDRYQTAARFRDALSDLLFHMGFRVGPADVGRIAADYRDPSPEAAQRLLEQGRRFRVRTPTAVNPMMTAAEPVTPPPVALGTAVGFEWGVAPPRTPSSSAVSPVAAPAGPRSSPSSIPPRSEIEMLVKADSAVAASRPASTSGPTSSPSGSLPGPASSIDPGALSALHQALSQPLSVVDLDQYEAPSFNSAPAAPPPIIEEPRPVARAAADAPAPPAPDNSGDLSVLSPLRVIADLAVSHATGLLQFELDGKVEQIYLVRGAPESITSNQPAGHPGGPFGEYLVATGSLKPPDLQRAAAQLGRFSGKLVDALIATGPLKQIDVFRLQSQYVRERMMELFTWTQGTFSFFRGRRDPALGPALALDGCAILGAGALTLTREFLESRFAPVAEFRPLALIPSRISPDAFRLGTRPRELLLTLDGRRTVSQVIARSSSGSDLLRDLRVLYLLVETDLARLE